MALFISTLTLICLIALVLVLTGVSDKIIALFGKLDKKLDETPNDDKVPDYPGGLPYDAISALSHYGYLYNNDDGVYRAVYAGVINGILLTLSSFGKEGQLSVTSNGNIDLVQFDEWTQIMFEYDKNVENKELFIMKDLLK